MDWNYDSSTVEEFDFTPIPIGKHRVRIAELEETTSSNGNDMLKFTFEVSGYNSRIFWYLVFMNENEERRKLTNNKLFQIYKSFDIPEGNMNFSSWIGHVGVAKVFHEEYQGEPQAKIKYFITKDEEKAKLPPWEDPANTQMVDNIQDFFDDATEISDEDLPFK